MSTNQIPPDQSRESQGAGSPPGPTIALNEILAPVDFSAASRHGVAFAAAVAERFHGQLHLVHVVEPPALPEWGYAHIPMREARLRKDAEERLPRFPVECDIDPARVHSNTVLSGDADLEICRAAADRKIDLIVLASHGLGGINHAFFGSTVERVVRRAPCPVLTVRDRALREGSESTRAFDLKKIIVTTDFSAASKKAFPYAVALARKFEAALTLLYVMPSHLPADSSHIGVLQEEQRLVEQAREKLPQFRHAEIDPHLHVETTVLTGSPAHEICEAARAQTADIIVIATHGHTGLKHFLPGSVTERVVRHAPCPVLVVREREHEFVRV